MVWSVQVVKAVVCMVGLTNNNQKTLDSRNQSKFLHYNHFVNHNVEQVVFLHFLTACLAWLLRAAAEEHISFRALDGSSILQ